MAVCPIVFLRQFSEITWLSGKAVANRYASHCFDQLYRSVCVGSVGLNLAAFTEITKATHWHRLHVACS